MARTACITSDIWMDEDFCMLSSEEKNLWFYLLSSPLSNIAGFYRLPPEYVTMAINKNITSALQSPGKMWKYDAMSKQVLIPNFFKHNTPKSLPQMKAVAKAVKSLERCPLMVDFFFGVYKYCPQEIFEHFDDRLKDYVRVEAKKRNDRVGAVVQNIP